MKCFYELSACLNLYAVNVLPMKIHLLLEISIFVVSMLKYLTWNWLIIALQYVTSTVYFKKINCKQIKKISAMFKIMAIKYIYLKFPGIWSNIYL